MVSEKVFVLKDGWVLCSACWGKLFRVEQDAQVKGVHAFCKRCKAEVEVNIFSSPA